MASVCILDEFHVHKNEEFLSIAEELKTAGVKVTFGKD